MKKLLLIAKIVLCVGLFVYILNNLDISTIYKNMINIQGLYCLIICIVFSSLQIFISALRLMLFTRIYNQRIHILMSLRTIFLGAFFSQAMISFVGGDAMRIWYLSRQEIPIQTAARAVLLDRVIGFIALIFLFILTMPFLLEIVQDSVMKISVCVMAIVSVSAITSFLLLGRLPQAILSNKYLSLLVDFISVSRHLFYSMRYSTMAFCLALITHIINVFAVYWMILVCGEYLSLFWSFVLVSPIMLISMLPISFAGWGVRETAMITGLGILGVSSVTALSASISMGLSLVISAIPGVIIFLMARNKPTTNSIVVSGLHNIA